MADPIRLVVGDDWVLPFTYRDSAGVAIDLTGFGVGGDVLWPDGKIGLDLPNGSAVLLDQSLEATRGKFVLTLDRAASTKIPANKPGTHLRAFLITPDGDIRSFPAWPLCVEAR
jgi:hypothetical protein